MVDRPALDGYWLPNLVESGVEFYERPFGPGHVQLRIPALTPRALREALIGLRARRAETLAARTTAEILVAVEAAGRHLTQPGRGPREELLALLPELTGYSRRMIEIGLERMARGWTAGALRAALQGEFGNLELLDDFQPRPTGGLQRAFGPELSVHVFSGNIPGISVSSLIRALCVKSASFGKTAAGEPYLAVSFARALAEHDPALAACLGICYWPGGSEELEDVAFAEADAVIAYGSDETIARLAPRVRPTTRFLGYPNRVGAALLSRRALSPARAAELARDAAADVATFDQQGCVSPHVIYVERGGAVDPLEFAHKLADALQELAAEVPRGKLTPAESTLIHQLRAQAEVRGATVLASQRGTDWTVIVEDRAEFEPSPLNRVIQVRLVSELSDALAALKPVGRHLQTVALGAEGEEARRLAAQLGAIGVTRIVPVGQAAWPAPDWHHDGRFQFLDLVRFVDLEPGSR